jgi:hypothetical protein
MPQTTAPVTASTMTQPTGPIIPQASLREEWSVSSVERLAWSLGRPLAHYTRVADPARRSRRAEALRRLAADPAATVAERALAAHRLVEMGAGALRAAC